MKKSTKIILHVITGAIVSAISFIGFKKGIEAVNDRMEKDTVPKQNNKPDQTTIQDKE